MSKAAPQRVDLGKLRELLVSAPGQPGIEAAGAYLFAVSGLPGKPGPVEALAALHAVLHKLLLTGRWGEAGVLLWGKEVFNPEPWSVSQVIAQWKRSKKSLIFGGGSLGKTFSVAALTYLDWRLDPAWTAIKIISQTQKHAKTNMFATLKRLHQDAAIPLQTAPGEMWIRVNASDDRHGIMQVSIPKGESGEGVLKGFHPVPRTKPHPKLGNMSRVRAVIDEGEHVPVGVWTGADNMLLSIDPDGDDLRVTCVTNPREVTSEFARRAEPDKGWGKVDPDNDVTWRSIAGYDVLRLDAKMTENVKTGRIVFQGFQTASGYAALIQANGGADSVGAWTLGRGMYPRQGAVGGVFNAGLIDRMTGGFVWVGLPRPIGGEDPALQGADSSVLTAGVCGMASHWRDAEGKETKFDSPRMCVLAEGQMEFPKGDSVVMARCIKEACTPLRIDAEALAMDATGTGEGVHSQLVHSWGNVHGVIYGSSATERKIIAEDDFTPKDRYADLSTELWFAARSWAEHNLLKVAPGCLSQRLRAELEARKFRVVGKGIVRLRSKEEDQVRGKSPDAADSFTLIVESARNVAGSPMATGAKLPGRQVKPEDSRRQRAAEKLDELNFVDFTADDRDDILSGLGHGGGGHDGMIDFGG